jgi:hypothetical protein
VTGTRTDFASKRRDPLPLTRCCSATQEWESCVGEERIKRERLQAIGQADRASQTGERSENLQLSLGAGSCALPSARSLLWKLRHSGLYRAGKFPCTRLIELCTLTVAGMPRNGTPKHSCPNVFLNRCPIAA